VEITSRSPVLAVVLADGVPPWEVGAWVGLGEWWGLCMEGGWRANFDRPEVVPRRGAESCAEPASEAELENVRAA